MLAGINEETGEKTIGQRVGTYASGTVGVAPVYDLLHIPERMKDAVRVRLVEYFTKTITYHTTQIFKYIILTYKEINFCQYNALRFANKTCV